MHLLELPAEIREEIYRPILDPSNYRETNDDDYTTYNYRPALSSLLRINRQIYHEARRIFLNQNTFICIETPWDQAQEHVKLEGHVPILASREQADNFKDHSLVVTIRAPDFAPMEHALHKFIIHVDDLHKFTESWRYSDMDNPHLNRHLSLSLCLRDPIDRAPYSDPSLPKALQSRLLLPFGIVKDLHSLQVHGSPQPYTSLVTQLKTLQAAPHASPESCLAETTRLKDLGNADLKNGAYASALTHYRAAWRAMHIVVSGRQRHVHAEGMFNGTLTAAPFAGQNGQTVRLALRVKLVANTVLVYLKLGDWDTARFWGTRTIDTMRTAMGLGENGGAERAEDEAILGFVAAAEMGKIYYRTALAWKELGDKGEARRLLRVASVYLPQDQSVQREIAACALRLG